MTRVEAEQNEARSKLLLECDSLNTKQQAIVAFVELLQPQVADLKFQMTLVNEGHGSRASDTEGRRSRGEGPCL